MFPDNSFRGFGHVEFATAAEAEKVIIDGFVFLSWCQYLNMIPKRDPNEPGSSFSIVFELEDLVEV